MTDAKRTSDAQPAEPPGGGRQDHDTMRAASMHPVSGPASTDILGASGGLNVPGNEAHPELAAQAPGPAHGGDAPGPAPHEPIPGERDASTMTHRQAGAVGGQFAGADIPSEQRSDWIDKRTAYEHAREGGADAVKQKK